MKVRGGGGNLNVKESAYISSEFWYPTIVRTVVEVITKSSITYCKVSVDNQSALLYRQANLVVGRMNQSRSNLSWRPFSFRFCILSSRPACYVACERCFGAIRNDRTFATSRSMLPNSLFANLRYNCIEFLKHSLYNSTIRIVINFQRPTTPTTTTTDTIL